MLSVEKRLVKPVLTLTLFRDVPGGLTGGVTPVPIPNTEVKPSKADDTAAVRQWESRTLPGYKKGPLVERSAGFLLTASWESRWRVVSRQYRYCNQYLALQAGEVWTTAEFRCAGVHL